MNLRKKYIINKNFQFKFIMVMLAMALIVACVFYASHFFFFREFDIIAEQLALPAGHPFRNFIEMQKGKSFNLFIISGFCSTFVICVAGAFFSHRIAGPLYRINNLLQEMAKNSEVKDFKVRKSDFFQEIPDSLNEAMKSFKKKDEL